MARGLSEKQRYSRFYNRFSGLKNAVLYAGGTATIKQGSLKAAHNGVIYYGYIRWSSASNGECFGEIICYIDKTKVSYNDFKEKIIHLAVIK